MSDWNKTIQKMFASENPELKNVVHARTEESPMPGQQIPKSKSIYDDPNHPLYGPARRLHLILLYLFSDLDERNTNLIDRIGYGWDTMLEHELEDQSEAKVARLVIRTLEKMYN